MVWYRSRNEQHTYIYMTYHVEININIYSGVVIFYAFDVVTKIHLG